MTRIPGWDDEVPFIGGEAREALEQLVSETELPPPDEWDAYTVHIDAAEGTVSALISAEGDEFEINAPPDIDIEALTDWDWVWDIWEWLVENFPDVDLDSEYE